MQGLSIAGKQQTPQFISLPEPEPRPGELLVEVEAAALSNLVRAQANGSHYSSSNVFPFTPGNDGVGRLRDGRRVYFLSPRAPFGSMAERCVVPSNQVLDLPQKLGSVQAAAMGNPGLATWGALLGRARLVAGEGVLVNGATGVTGREAVRVAKKLGAGKVVATGRRQEELQQLLQSGADTVISLQQPDDALQAAFRNALESSGITVLLDYLWGRSAELLLGAIAGSGHADRMPRIRFVQIGSISGQQITLPASTLRSSGVELLGSGLGSLSMPQILASLRQMYAAWTPGDADIATVAVPLTDGEAAWNQPTGGSRLVFTM